MGSTTSAGTTLKVVASAPATFDATGYGALTFVAVGEVTNIGEFGRVYASIAHKPIDTRGTVKKKGSFDEGTLNLALAIDVADAGQGICETALDSDDPLSVEITTPDGTIYYMQGNVLSFTSTPGGVDDIFAGAITLDLTTADDGTGIVKVEA